MNRVKYKKELLNDIRNSESIFIIEKEINSVEDFLSDRDSISIGRLRNMLDMITNIKPHINMVIKYIEADLRQNEKKLRSH